ncbi:MAG: hypothetical protein ABF868_08170 [Sporolactobacillus sp.]
MLSPLFLEQQATISARHMPINEPNGRRKGTAASCQEARRSKPIHVAIDACLPADSR